MTLGLIPMWPFAVRAQQPKNIPRIGFLTTGSIELPEMRAILRAFHQGLSEYGYIDGQNILVEVRSAESQVERFPALASDLVRLNVDLIVASNSLAARAVRKATTTIPIVVPVMGDPVGDGLVASLARPGGNITGLTFLGPQLVPKRLALLKEALPSALWVAADALLVFPSPMLFAERKRIVELGTEHRLPIIAMGKEFVQLGGLLSYGADIVDFHRRCATYIDRILKGARPADLPVEQPTKFELFINLKTAKELGLEVPATLLARADEVIE